MAAARLRNSLFAFAALLSLTGAGAPTAAQAPARYAQPPRWVEAVQLELTQIDAELAALRRRRPRTFWPAAVLSLAGGIGASVGLVNLVLWGLDHRRRYGWDAEGNRYEYIELDDAAKAEGRGAGIGLGVGLPMLAAGLTLFVPALRARHALAHERRPLRVRRRQLLEELRFQVQLDGQRRALGVGLRY